MSSKRSAWLSPLRGLGPLFENVQLLDFGRCKLCIAVPDGFDYQGPRSLQGKRIATTYPHILARFLKQHGVAADVVVLSGSVEVAPRLGRADLICDLVSTGSTLAANHLRQAEVVLESQAVLIRTPMPIPAEKQEWTRRLLMRIDMRRGAIERQYRYACTRPLALAPRSRSCFRATQITDGHSFGRPGRPGSRPACGVCRENVFQKRSRI